MFFRVIFSILLAWRQRTHVVVPESWLLIKPLEQLMRKLWIWNHLVSHSLLRFKLSLPFFFSKNFLSLQPSNYGICLFITFYQDLFMQIMHIIVVCISIKKIIKTNNYFVLIGFWKINMYCFLMSRVNMQVLYCLKYPLD